MNKRGVFLLAVIVILFTIIILWRSTMNTYSINGYEFISYNKLNITDNTGEFVKTEKNYLLEDNSGTYSLTIVARTEPPWGVFTGTTPVVENCMNLINNENCIHIVSQNSVDSANRRFFFMKQDVEREPSINVINNIDNNAPYLAVNPYKYLRDYQLGDWFPYEFKALGFNSVEITYKIRSDIFSDEYQFAQAENEVITLIRAILNANKAGPQSESEEIEKYLSEIKIKVIK